MPELPQPTTKKQTGSRTSRSGIFIGGTLVVLIAGGIAMQVWRAEVTLAAEQKAGDTQSRATLDASKTAFARVNGEPPLDP